MKRSLLIGLALCLAGPACTRQQLPTVQNEPPITQPPAASPSPSPAVPVQLAGLVNNMGVKDFSGVGTNIAVEFQIKDFSFTPTFIKVLPGTNVNIQLDNMGPAEHTFTIDSLKVDHQLAAGGQVEGQFKLPDSGVIPFYCRFHVGQGMQGAFYFQEGGAASASPSPADSAGTSSSSGTKKKSASSIRRPSANAPAAGAQNREGDLVIPDLVIGGPQAGNSTATTLPRVLPAASPRSSPRPGTTTATNKVTPQKAASGAAGKPSDPGTPGEEGEEGTPGEAGETN